ncbi:hypothetical protein CVE36_10030, partial [Pseudomonas syringae pv. actinidiae]|nr:hypothetical protein [Pseudomonas syringae pv. actinidiae]
CLGQAVSGGVNMLDDSTALPRLRQELQLESSPGNDGEMSWRIYDPWQHRFFQLPESDVMLLSRPGCRTIGQLKPLLDLHGLRFDMEQFGSLTLFLRQQHLLMAQDYAASAEEKPKALLLRKPSVRQLPLWDPMPLLHLVAGHHLRWLTRALLTLWLIVTLVGLYLTARQWDSYLATFSGFLFVAGCAGVWRGDPVSEVVSRNGTCLCGVSSGLSGRKNGYFPVCYLSDVLYRSDRRGAGGPAASPDVDCAGRRGGRDA